MIRPFTGCVLSGAFTSPSPEFMPLVSALRYQGQSLGMEIENHTPETQNGTWQFQLKTPQTQAVQCTVNMWDSQPRSPATEHLLQAGCGLMSVHGRAIGRCLPLGVDYVSTLTSALAMQGGVAAALAQLRGLPLRHSDTSMAAAAMLSMGQYLAGATANEGAEVIRPDTLVHPDCPPFVSADGVVFELETLDAEPWRRFWVEMGIEPGIAGKGWTAFLLRYAKAIAPLPEVMINALATRGYQQILHIAASTGMALSPVRSLLERSGDQDAKAVWLNGPWDFQTHAIAPGIGFNPCTGELPLSGLTVIESCRRIQGPLAGHLLALLGATVIRIEPPGGDPLRGMPPLAEGCSARFDALNRLKTIREIDIKSTAGQAEIQELVRHADVFLHNWAPGKAAPLHLDYPDLLKLNPALVYAYAAGWATDRTNAPPLNNLPGTDFTTQAYSGVAQKIAQSSGKHGGSLFTVLDVLGGVIAAQGVTIALLNRQLHKVSSNVTSSLMTAATFLCHDDFRLLYQTDAVPESTPSTLAGVYETQSGKLAIDCQTPAMLSRLSDLIDLPIDDFEPYLRELLLSKTAAEWADLFNQADIPAIVVVEDLSVLTDQAHLQTSLKPGPYTQVTSPWRFQ